MRRIEIGSGTRPMLDAFHIDINPNLPQIDLVREMDDLHGVDDESFDELFAIHVIEHVPISRARKALREWRRVLAPDGKAHIDTPNLERNAALYLNGGWERDFDILTPAEQARLMLNGVPNKTLWLNFKCFSSEHAWDVHFWNADAELLPAMCLEAGFARVKVHQTEPSLIVHAWV